MNAQLLAFDPAVPHRDRLLDAGAMHDQLSLIDGGPASAWRVVKVKYQPGRDLRIVYRDGGAADRLIVARTVPHSQETRFRLFPRDRRLPLLPDVMAPAAPLRSLVDGAWTASRLAGYAPEKCAVVACLNGNPDRPLAYAKLFAHPEEARAAFAIAVAVADRFAGRAAGCAVPRPLCFEGTHHLLFVEAAHGRRLTALGEDAAIDATRRLGGALAELHDSGIDLPVAGGGRTSDRQLEHAAALIAAARPERGAAAAALARRLMGTRPRSSSFVPLHGDVHIKNAVLDGERLWLIDFDQAYTGPASADLGSFLAVLRVDALIGARTPERAAALATAFLGGYADVRPLPPAAELRWQTSAALFAERAQRGITRMRRDVLVRLPTVLDEADRNLRRGAA